MSGSAGAAGTSITATTEPVDATDTSGTDAATDPATDAARAADRTARLQEVLKPLVDDGKLTQVQVDSVVATLEAAGPIGGGGHGGPGGHRGPGFSVVATTLGMTEAEVRDAISNGQTLAQLAEAKGSTAQALIDAILADHKSHLDEEVAAGELTQAEADAKLADATTRVTDFVNNTDATKLMGPGGRGPRPDAPADDATATDATATDATT
jgi:polyhydroxyalkanoate synthesis regulator phasin